MARNLYRLYLYMVFIAMLVLAAVGLGMMLQPLLGLTPLRGEDAVPAGAVVVQGMVFAVVSWVIALLLGGLHYRLIQRDLKSDAGAGSSAVRAFFLNATEAISLPLGVAVASYAIGQIGQPELYGIPGELAVAIPALGLFAVVELERRRTEAGRGAAVVFQRLHLYGVQLVLLFILTYSWLTAVNQLVDALAFDGNGWAQAFCNGGTVCQGPHLFLIGSAASALWGVLFWMGYGFLTRSDKYSLLQQILCFLGFAYGAGFGLYGVERGVELALRAVFGSPAALSEITGPAASYAFVPAITLGLLTVIMYSFWLQRSARQQPMGRVTISLVEEAVSGLLMAGVFWWGMGLVLLNALESVGQASVHPNAVSWAMACAFVVAGAAYVVLDVHLQRRSERVGSVGPRRTFVFILLGGGIVAGAVGLLVLLYTLLTALLGSPVANWQDVARQGGSALAVGIVLVGIYLWAALHEHLFTTHRPRRAGEAEKTRAEVEAVGVIAQPSAEMKQEAGEAQPINGSGMGTIEGVLDELQAGKITRNEAAALLRGLMNVAQS